MPQNNRKIRCHINYKHILLELSVNRKGEVSFSDELKGIGFEIINRQNRYDSCHNKTIKVICLKDLIDKTFKCDWKKGYASSVESSKRRRGK